MLRLHPGDRLVRHINSKMITGLVWRLYPDGSIKNRRSPLVSLATDETIKLVETRMSRPTIERPGNRNLPRRCFVILAKGSRAKAIESQHLCQWCDALRANTCIPRKRGGEFHDSARVVDVMVASG